jgi:phage terminase large subunit
VLGLDVAGTGDDENVVAPRRGKKILELEAWHTPALPTPEERAKAVAARVMSIVRRHRREREGRALVVMDAGGTIGAEIYRELLRFEDEIQVRPVQFGAKSAHPREYQLIRDQLWFTFAERWLQDGGALPPDRKLPAELTAPGWVYDVRDQRRHVERKDALRRRLGRSTDRADACLLSVYEPPSVRQDAKREAEEEPMEQFDPVYGGVERRHGGFDPYAGAMRRGGP